MFAYQLFVCGVMDCNLEWEIGELSSNYSCFFLFHSLRNKYAWERYEFTSLYGLNSRTDIVGNHSRDSDLLKSPIFQQAWATHRNVSALENAE